MPPSAVAAAAVSLPPLPLDGWHEWRGLLVPDCSDDSSSDGEEALEIWLCLEDDTLCTDHTVLCGGGYALGGQYNSSTHDLSVVQSFSQPSTWRSREFRGVVAVGPHDEDSALITWKVEGTFVARPGSPTDRRKQQTGNFFCEVSGPPPTGYVAPPINTGAATPGAKNARRFAPAAVPLPENELLWEEETPPSRPVSQRGHVGATVISAPVGVPSMSLLFRLGRVSSSSSSSSPTLGLAAPGTPMPLRIDGTYDEEAAGPPTFRFTTTSSTEVRTYTGRFELDPNTGMVRLRGTHTRSTGAALEFLGAFLLRIAEVQPALPSPRLAHAQLVPLGEEELRAVAERERERKRKKALAENPSASATNSPAPPPRPLDQQALEKAAAAQPALAPDLAKAIDEMDDLEAEYTASVVATQITPPAGGLETIVEASQTRLTTGRSHTAAPSISHTAAPSVDLTAEIAAQLAAHQEQEREREAAEKLAKEAAAAEEAARLAASAARIRAAAAAKSAAAAAAATPASPPSGAQPSLGRAPTALEREENEHKARALAKAAEDARELAKEQAAKRAEFEQRLSVAQQRKVQLETERLARKAHMDAESARLAGLDRFVRDTLAAARDQRLDAIETAQDELTRSMDEEEQRRRDALAQEQERLRKKQEARERAQAARAAEFKRKQERELLPALPQAQAQAAAQSGSDEGEDGADPSTTAPTGGSRRFRDSTLAVLVAQEAECSFAPAPTLPKPKSDYEMLRNVAHERGILAHLFDLITTETTSSQGGEPSLPILAPALLPLTLTFDGEGVPLSMYHTDPSGRVRCTPWALVDPRQVFARFEENVSTARAQQAQVQARRRPGSPVRRPLPAVTSTVGSVEDLAAQLISIDGSSPPCALTLLEVGALLKNGVRSLKQLAPYATSAEGFIIQAIVFPPPTVSGSVSGAPKHTVYRCEFASAAFFECERRTCKHAFTPPPATSSSSSSSSSGKTSLTLSQRLASFKSAGADRDSVREAIGNRPSDTMPNRALWTQLRHICVSLLRRLNSQCAAVDVQVLRLRLYFSLPSGVDGPVHLLYGDRLDMRLVLPTSLYSFQARERARAKARGDHYLNLDTDNGSVSQHHSLTHTHEDSD